MRFYYWSFLNWIPLTIFYVIAAVLVLILWKLTKGDRGAPKLVWSLIVVMVVLPWTEELWIAWNFGKLCKKDAGIFVYKTVEVDGYYDATAGLWRVNNPVLPVTAENFDKRGYNFYEMSFADVTGGVTKVAHFEKVNGVWTPIILSQPTARYYYKELASHMPVTHEIKKFERVVVDQQTGDVLGRYLNYYRGAPWFFVGLDRPTIPCRETEEDTRKYGTISVHSLVFGRGPKGHVVESGK